MSRARIYPYANAMIEGKLTDTWTSTDGRYGRHLGCLVDTVEEIDTDYNGDGTADATGVAVAQIYRCVRNTSAAALTAGQVVSMEAGETNIDHVAAAPASGEVRKVAVRGVVVTPIAVGSEGWVVCQGYVNGIVDDTGSIASAGDALSVGQGGVAGTVQSYSVTTGTPDAPEAQIGMAFAAAASDAVPTIYIDVL